MSQANAVKAEISIRPNGAVYIGIEARRRLGLGYNDGVRVTLPNGETETISGYLDSSGHFFEGKSFYESNRYRTNGTVKKDAIVEPAALSWDDVNDLTDRRSDGCHTLGCK